MKYAVTPDQLREEGACFSGYNRVVRMLQGVDFDEDDEKLERYLELQCTDLIRLVDIANSNGLADAVWCLRCITDCERDATMFSVWCARQVQHLMKDPRSVASLDVAERFSDGKASVDELNEAIGQALLVDKSGLSDAEECAAALAVWCSRAPTIPSLTVYVTYSRAASLLAFDAPREKYFEVQDAVREKQKEMFIRMCNGDAPWQKKIG